MSARAFLRSSTAEAHERVDSSFSRFDLSDAAGYGRFLRAQAAAFLPVEEVLDSAGAADLIPDWPQRRRADLLRADLAALSVTLPEPFSPVLFIESKASMLGAAYVVEGSRLGGALLKRSVPAGLPSQFLDGRQSAGSWRNFLKLLDQFLVRPNDLEAAAEAARQVFTRFELAAKRELEVEVE
jgi:heme oxygenase (biliverdin-IX-beta and delta-forming)